MVHVTNKVTIATPVEISCKIDSVVKESKVETKVKLTFLLVGKVLITELLIVTRLLNRSKWTPSTIAVKIGNELVTGGRSPVSE